MLKLCFIHTFLDTFSPIFQKFGRYVDMCTINNRRFESYFCESEKYKYIISSTKKDFIANCYIKWPKEQIKSIYVWKSTKKL